MRARREPRNSRAMADLDNITATLGSQAWPFNQLPVSIGRVGRHRVYMSIATHDDLDAIADFMVEYGYMIKQDTGVIPLEVGFQGHMERTRGLMRDRYREAVKAIVDCSSPGRMTGVVLKVEHEARIKGVMALHIVSEAFDDPWSQNETRVHESQESPWIFPGMEYIRLLRGVITHDRNENRPILTEAKYQQLGVPYFMFSLENCFISTCIYGFSLFLKELVQEFKYSAIVNIHTGNLYAMIKPYLDVYLQYPECGSFKDDAPHSPQNCYPYKLHGKFMRPTPISPPAMLYLDDCVRLAFNRL
ncbi:hypothetical protein GGR51DRAFT_571280 [Nemania sp. FL0031]|nr:hypothetical protein GGR51DRAFT_571280 [Nemania sp. FL0031]